MKKDAEGTRKKLLDSAQALILDHGFGATTIDAIIERVGLSKGAFFHHFSNKAELGHALVKRYADDDYKSLEETLEQAESLSDDPLQQLLILVKLFEQEMEKLEEPYPGCLFASYLNQAELFDDEVIEIIREWMLKWRKTVMGKLEEIPIPQDVDPESLADMLLVIFEGAFVLSQSLKDPKTVARQLSHYHRYLKLLFK